MSAARSFGDVWFGALATGSLPPSDQLPRSLRVGAVDLDGDEALLVAITPDVDARFPRARTGEVGLEEGWGLASVVRTVIEDDRTAVRARPIVVVVDVPSQAYGYLEELLGIHQSLAAAVAALAQARLAGHPVIALIAGKAISGAFLATGLQANRIVALDHDGVMVQVMSKQSAARITRRTIAELDQIAAVVPATAYDGASFARLGAVDETIRVAQPSAPLVADVAAVVEALVAQASSARSGPRDLSHRLESDGARQQRAASIEVRRRVAAAWND